MNIEKELDRSWSAYGSGQKLYMSGGRLEIDPPVFQLPVSPMPGQDPTGVALGDAPTPTGGDSLARGFGAGVRDAAQQTLNLGGELVDAGANAITGQPVGALNAVKDLLPQIETDGMVENLTRGAVHIASAMMLTRGIGIQGTVANGAMVSALMDPEQGNLSSLAKEFGFDNELINFLDSKVGADASAEDRLYARMQNIFEGAGVGGLLDTVWAGFKAIKNNPAEAAKVAGMLTAGAVAGTPTEAEGGVIDKLARAGKNAIRTTAPEMSAVVQETTGALKVAPATTTGKALQLEPEYRVAVEGLPPVQGKGQYILNDINPKNVVEQSAKLDEIAKAFPDPLASTEAWSGMMARVFNSHEVPLPPQWLIDRVNDMKSWTSWLSGMTPKQITDTAQGFKVADDFRALYQSGAKADTTGQLMLWSILSRRMSAFPHESGFLDIAEAAQPFIERAASGVWTEADKVAWREMVQASIPQGSPGRSAISNANAFGDTFLAKMAETLPDGRSKLQALHEMFANPDMTGPQIRREFYGLAENVGIKNKVLSFALLVSGRNDVMVLDRIQINQMFGNGEKIYDNIFHLFDNGPGLAAYEALERSLGSRVKDLYASVGRPEDASIGRYHWETWLLTSGQEVSHPTLETIVKAGNKSNAPYAGTQVAEGRFHNTMFGATYEKLPGGGQAWSYRTQDGTPYQFQKSELDAMFKEVMKPKNGVVPRDFPGVSAFEGTDTPWINYQGVDREKLDEYIRRFGKPVKP